MSPTRILTWLNQNWPIPASVIAITAYARWGQRPDRILPMAANIRFWLANAAALLMPAAILLWALDRRARAMTRDGVRPALWPIKGLDRQTASNIRFGIAGMIVGYIAFAIGIAARILVTRHR